MTTYPVSSRGYNSSFRGALNPSAFYQVGGSDFGQPAPGTPSLAYNSGAGSLAMSTAHVKITWITTEGESLPSAEATAAISASSGAFTITQPTVPSGAGQGATVVGWRVYSSAAASSEELNSSALSTTQAQSTFVINKRGGGTSTLTGFPIATTAVQVLIYGTGATVPTIDGSGIQTAFPSVPPNTTADYDFIVPNSGSQWKTYKPVNFQRPNGEPETAGISLSANLDCISPLYPGATPGATTYTQVTVANGVYMVMNGYLFQATQAGSQSTATTFIGWAAFNTTIGGTTTDGSVTWTCLGKAVLVRAHFANSTASAAYPQQQQYDLFEL